MGVETSVIFWNLLFFVLLFFLTECEGIAVKIMQGELVGKEGRDRKGNVYYSFLSIPYAKSPVGDLRYKAPQEPEPWNGVLNATVDLPSCLQLSSGNLIGQEDCLYLNVHTPKLPWCKLHKSFPVFFYIHGGGYIEGSGSTQFLGPEFLIPANVVVVTINYRLGLFGFLSSKDESLGIPGNAGFKDQNMALRWVQNNIRKFGGDPNNVMIIGQSAGGASVHYHMLSPLSKGLFHKVVSMSGTALNPWAVTDLGSLEFLGKEKMGIQSGNSMEIFKKLNEMDVVEILKFETLIDIIQNLDKRFLSSLVIEKAHPGAFLTQTPMNIIISGNYTKVPYMLGHTNKEGLYLEVVYKLFTRGPLIINDFAKIIPPGLNKQGKNLEELKEKFRKFYFGNEAPSLDNLYRTIKMLGDATIFSGVTRVIQNQLKTMKNDVFLYQTIADTELNYIKKMTPQTANFKGCSHVDDLGYLFNTVLTPKIQKGSDEDLAINNIVAMFTNFLKTGKPRKDWLPITSTQMNFMKISVASVPGVDPDKEDFEFWNAIYEQYGLE